MRAVLAVVILLVVGCQGDPQKCEAAVRNYATLVYWKQADIDLAKAPAADRETLRKQKLSEFDQQVERGLPTLVSQCQAANNGDQVSCMTNAKTAEQAKACTK